MFDNSTCIQELETARVEALRAGVSPLDVNKAYNRRREQLRGSSPACRDIPTYPLNPRLDISYRVVFPIVENGVNPTVIRVDPSGVYM